MLRGIFQYDFRKEPISFHKSHAISLRNIDVTPVLRKLKRFMKLLLAESQPRPGAAAFSDSTLFTPEHGLLFGADHLRH